MAGKKVYSTKGGKKATGNKHKLTASEQKRSDVNRKARDKKVADRKKSRT